ncbi:type II secretion system GspH family protein [Patescibacteria group bacterium]|nr:type II secretion system GspH family protein [Patescibacteria group bacterium]
MFLFNFDKRIKESKKGFALIEVIISVALFSVVMTVGIGSLLNMISANKKSQSLKVVVNNINLAMEGMSKEIRVGYDYNCGFLTGGDCSVGSDSIYFTSKNGESIVYRLDGGVIQKSVAGGSFNSITAQDTVIYNLTFYVLGSSSSDFIQPRVIIIVRGYKGDRVKDKLEFDLQTTVTQRRLDL